MRNPKVKELKERMAKVVEFLPTHYMGLITDRYPQYKTHKGADKVRNCINLKCSDELLTEQLEELVGIKN